VKFIIDQIDALIQTATVDKPKITIGRYSYSYNNNLKFIYNDTAVIADVTGIDDKIKDATKRYMRVKLSLSTNNYKLLINKEDAVNSIIYETEHSILRFLSRKAGFVNNKLSKIYRWYREALDKGFLKSDEDFFRDLFNISKYIDADSYGGQPLEEKTESIKALLVLIKDRYECKFNLLKK